MKIDIISAVPELLDSPFQHSIMKRAAEKSLFEVVVHDLRKYGIGKHNKIDDYQYGGGAGMVMCIEPILKCISEISAGQEIDEIIYMTPDGEEYSQKMANHLSMKKHMIIICGHYKGIDERLREHVVTKEISIGSYVLSGGELAAAVVVDSIGRLLPGVLNDETSALFDSYQDDMLAPPVYTRPADYNGWKVPDILLSGNDGKIEEWREDRAYERTKERRPNLLKPKDE
ncbi:tRNA (guanosine(37)-N1)-methyltransferase TrmD [Portibacter lacus]|uniref:tRNA (guanine-N(1)-)-methyltransferase n=1 Tax=Portibacter lacus TaxID=1099794 RepID=A0AA37STM9_9BACT|nr:tRNA (guanosine(37)-N1)-methyltransferase TrmD [Portibacter lacus]GLR20047.1 tRNA (guanine-N(1)-)-methyltransferase [Portibacter lacus]